MEDDRRAGKLAKGTRGQFKGRERSGGLRNNPPEKQTTLADQASRPPNDRCRLLHGGSRWRDVVLMPVASRPDFKFPLRGRFDLRLSPLAFGTLAISKADVARQISTRSAGPEKTRCSCALRHSDFGEKLGREFGSVDPKDIW
jgi:hypothetical protein